jgi:hypothetical protein
LFEREPSPASEALSILLGNHEAEPWP